LKDESVDTPVRFASDDFLKHRGGAGGDDLGLGGGGTKFSFTIPPGWSGIMVLARTGSGLSVTVEEAGFKDGGGSGGEDDLKPGGGAGGEDDLKPGGGGPPKPPRRVSRKR